MISGINPSSYNDYPKEVSYVIFLGGCNFRCPFCHNSSIVNRETETITLEHVVNSLQQRKNFIKAVVITGGEPTIYGKDLINLISTIKALGFKVKLDTNGTNPQLLKELIDKKLLDYIAMDIKNTFAKYELTVDHKVAIEDIKESINIIENSGLGYEFRTTVNKTQHLFEDIQEIATYLKDKQRYFLQNYRYSKEQIDKCDFIAFEEDELKQLKDMLAIEVKI